MLIIFSGLPGTGKAVIASKAARELGAVYLRIDSLEMGIIRSGLVADQWSLGPAGYCAAYAVAMDNLKNGMTVIADSVNSLKVTRDVWRNVAIQAATPYLEVEVLCSDEAEHKRRVGSRKTDVEGLRLPNWQQVMDREYEPWSRERLVLDTAGLSVNEAVAGVVAACQSV